jgi:PKHD-type hydroxylase
VEADVQGIKVPSSVSGTLEKYPCQPLTVELFTPKECDEIASIVVASRFEDAAVGLLRPEIASLARSARICWLTPQENTEWVFRRLKRAIAAVNAECWRYDLRSIGALQFTRYELGDHFQWHTDVGIGRESLRKLSFSVQLSESNRYTGGTLQFRGLKAVPADRRKGFCTVFPSFLLHRVTPVWRGARLALVGWADGAQPLR